MDANQTELKRHSALSFPIALADGRTISEIGDVADLFESLTEAQRGSSHWSIAVRMLEAASEAERPLLLRLLNSHGFVVRELPAAPLPAPRPSPPEMPPAGFMPIRIPVW